MRVKNLTYFSSLVISFLLAHVSGNARAETTSFMIEEIQTVNLGPDAVHPRENPIGRISGLATVEFALAFVNDSLQFYATVYDSPDSALTFSVVANIYYNNDQWFAYFPRSTTIDVPAKSELYPLGGAFYKVHGNFEHVSKSDLEKLQNLRLEVTWNESSETDQTDQ